MLKKLITCFFMTIFLCGCASQKNYKEITFSSWGSITEVKILNKLISDFEKENPDIKINFIHIPQNYFQKLHLLFLSSQTPDVIFINNLYLPVYASYLQEITNVDKNIFFNQGLEALSFEGHLYAVPRDISTLVFYKNNNIVKTTPKNIEDFENVIKNYSDTNHYAVSYEPNIYYSIPYIYSFGGSINNFGVPDEKAMKAIEFYKNMQGKYAPAPHQAGSLTQAQMFIQGRIGLYLSGRWMYPIIKKEANFPWEVIIFPGITSLDASGWAISKSSKNKEAAIKFVQFLSSKESIEYFTKTGLIVPARKDCTKNLEAVFINAIKYSKPTVVNKKYNKITDKLNREFFN